MIFGRLARKFDLIANWKLLARREASGQKFEDME